MQTLTPQKAFIFAAGLGTRMRPLTDEMPKPLVKVGGKALIDYQIDMVMDAGVKQIGINSFYLADKLEGHLQKYLQKGVDIKIFRESERLETGGGLANATEFVNGETIFTLNSDVIFCYKNMNPLTRLLRHWNPEKYDCLMLLTEKEKATGYYGDGNFDIRENGTLNSDGEKKYIFTGLQLLNAKVLERFAAKKIFSLSEVFADLASRNRLSGIIHDDQWLHIGCIKGLQEAENYIRKNQMSDCSSQ